jgi:proteasome beta subunit
VRAPLDRKDVRLAAGSSSFTDFLTMAAPELLLDAADLTGVGGVGQELPHGTTIVGAVCAGGVVMGGDRRVTAGSMIGQRDFEKVFRSDEFSWVGIAGVVGLAVDMVRPFQVELEHYEKIEGRSLSLEDKANRLAGLVKRNLGIAMQGLVTVPILARCDGVTRRGRIFSYKADGGRYEEQRFVSIGSGSVFARGALKKLYRDDLQRMSCSPACRPCTTPPTMTQRPADRTLASGSSRSSRL